MGWMLDAELLWHDGMQSLSRESDIDPSSAKHQGCACDCISLSRIKSIWRTRHLWPPLVAQPDRFIGAPTTSRGARAFPLLLLYVLLATNVR